MCSIPHSLLPIFLIPPPSLPAPSSMTLSYSSYWPQPSSASLLGNWTMLSQSLWYVISPTSCHVQDIHFCILAVSKSKKQDFPLLFFRDHNYVPYLSIQAIVIVVTVAFVQVSRPTTLHNVIYVVFCTCFWSRNTGQRGHWRR